MVEKKIEHNVSEAEWEVMRIIWTLGETHTGDVIEQLQTKKHWSESTIKTLMGRLVKKGLLQTRKDGRRFAYSATVSQIEMMIKVTNQLMDHMCDMHKGQVLIEILKGLPLSQSDIATIENELILKKAHAPKMVPCNCLASGQHNC
ncbi:copper transport repressor, CopY/TcrY family [Lactobacillus bombicola]|uniref:Copper transport repressor, CopY/TcrY family n=1 Tax=Lactobacillus bombicola TaxID=1505723 RepID=A0A1I1SHV1_9LACO|nr:MULTISPECIES: CopY/TcrY family copper transport repressor [Lactobacillus]MCO6527661.1 CopY/TcrY family copper transport repressor [Lactobacillus sp.]RMC40814.1 CopY/TcrY family copper transport repressor [Lactobacillus sp. ESL0237]RMC42230.1 CopY/TcrY family copper transport repressor [Lactobacillus sp. ESL0233]RMC44569.1 CopY/TcrY family copper transport repressor [Lactobacillus sp. ESL0234]RMC45876.1 CopY/TcrY family copper transport repressor [Lactobacillus sp. ESL0236]